MSGCQGQSNLWLNGRVHFHPAQNFDEILLPMTECGARQVICRPRYFPFIVKKFRSVCGAAARRRHVSLTTDGIIIKSSGNDEAFHLLICVIYLLFLPPLATQRGGHATRALFTHGLRRVGGGL